MTGPDSGADRLVQAVAVASETRAIRFGPGAVELTGECFAEQFPGRRALVVADQNTYRAAGRQAVASLRQAGVELAAEPFCFPGSPTLYCSYDNTVRVREYWQDYPNAVVCSIASGTLNDVVKLAAGELRRPYLNVCTAASVDGYSAFGASIERDGFKITRPCPAPVALIADVEVMAAAPARLTATGYGDLIEKLPAGADWILADELGIEPIRSSIWEMVQPASRAALAEAELIAAADHGAIADLAEANLLSGLAMQAHQSSRPASGAGHLFSHIWEMEGHGLAWEPPLTHGFKVGIGTIASCALWQAALELDLSDPVYSARPATTASPEALVERCRALLEPRVAEAAIDQALAKQVVGAELTARREAVRRQWPRIQQRCREQLIGPELVARRLKIVGAPHHPSQIQISADRLARTYLQAQLIRSRYTILDLLAEFGILEQVVDGLFGPKGYWGGTDRATGVDSL